MASEISVFPFRYHKSLKVHGPRPYLSAVAEHHQKTGHKPDLDNIKMLCRGDQLIPHRVRDVIFIRKETSPILNKTII